ncbi:ABC transporter permease [Candidatus Uhrbacteria bacterium]|nr:ABC transporter permease [Candidatus Uhrbacteria bacterium]
MQSSKTSSSVITDATKTTRTYWPAGLFALFLFGLWHFVTAYGGLIDPLFLPSPIKVINAAIALGEGNLFIDVLATVMRVMVAFGASILIALPLALVMSESRFLKQLLIPYIDFVRYIPVPVLIPLTILFFGIGEEAKIVLLFIGTFFQVVLLFESNLMHVPKEYFDLAYSLHFSTFQRLAMKLQSAIPEMYDNMRISLGLSWSYVIIVELVAAQTGIGHMIKEAQRFSLTANVYVGILIMGIIGFISDYLFRKSYTWFFPYKK